jgi:hypothetical protein
LYERPRNQDRIHENLRIGNRRIFTSLAGGHHAFELLGPLQLNPPHIMLVGAAFYSQDYEVNEAMRTPEYSHTYS